MDETFLVFAFLTGMAILASVLMGRPSKEQVKALLKLKNVEVFVTYCETHKDDLPEKFRERFDEMEKALKE